MSFPPKPVKWAENVNYPAGADPWSGTPTKVEPTTTVKDQGFTPETPGSAQEVNYVLNAFAETTNAAVLASIANWNPLKVAPFTADRGVLRRVGFFHKRSRKWYVSKGTNDYMYTPNFGNDWVTFTVTTATWLFPQGMANNNPSSGTYGDMLFWGANTGVSNTTARRYNWATKTFANVTLPVAGFSGGAFHDPVNATWICIAFSAGTTYVVQNAPDTTYVFTNRSAGLPAHTMDVIVPCISTTGVILLPCDTLGAVLRSADGGTTWTKVTLPAPMFVAPAMCWIPERAEFIYQANAANAKAIYASTDGITWTLRSATNPIHTLSANGAFYCFDALGSVVWASWNTENSATGEGSLAYSLDGGETWGFCSDYGTDGRADFINWGGRGMLAIGDDSVMAFNVKEPSTLYKGVGFLRNIRQVTFNVLG